MAGAVTIFAKESGRMQEAKMAALLAMNNRAAQRMELKDKLHLTGNHVGIEVLVAEREEDKRQRNLILSQDEVDHAGSTSNPVLPGTCQS